MNRTDESVLASFFRADGTLHTIPAKRAKLLVVLDRLAQDFEPYRRYPEAAVNELLGRVHPDYAALRRFVRSQLAVPVTAGK